MRGVARNGALGLVLATALLVGAPAVAAPWPCVPPVFEGGQRLHALPARVLTRVAAAPA